MEIGILGGTGPAGRAIAARLAGEFSKIVSRLTGSRPLDAGGLSNAMAIEAFTAVLLQLNSRYHTRVAVGLTGIGYS